MYLIIIILPITSSIISGFVGRIIGTKGAHTITVLAIIITTIFSFLVFIEVCINNIPVYIDLFKWLESEILDIKWSFQFDSLTASMLIPVLIISSLVHMYSIEYMNNDPHNQRFFSYLSLFTFMMIILVTANNYLLMFVGWEGVGVCSYLLVNFWFTRIAANQSSISAFLTNRVGDCFLTIGMFIIIWSIGNLDYAIVFSTVPFLNENILTLIGICLLIGAMAKSSQIGLHVWLPMAMEGPTPVSALIHAATMVTAGVYLLIRSSPLIEYSSTVLLICMWLGSITTVFSSLIGLFQQDIKKVIAYSTMSQLGMMVIAIGLSSYHIALFHLINHAFYKGLLFLSAGSIIHAVADNQDFRKYGGLINLLPLTYSVMLIGSLSLIAFPFMTGFYSKDFIIESSYGKYSFNSLSIYIISIIGAIFTSLYSVKVLYLIFFTKPNGRYNFYINEKNLIKLNNKKKQNIIYNNNNKLANESGIYIKIPLIILGIFSIIFGYICKDLFTGLGSNLYIYNSIFIYPTREIMINTEVSIPVLIKLIPFIFSVFICIAVLYIAEFKHKAVIKFKLSKLGFYIFGFFNKRFYIELFYNKYISNAILNLGGLTIKLLDKGTVELIGPFGLEKYFIKLSKLFGRNLNLSIITDYALYTIYILIIYIYVYNLNISKDICILVLMYILNIII